MKDPKQFAAFYEYLSEVSGKTGNAIAGGGKNYVMKQIFRFR